tara:strand:- start:545 stop:1291 length:747 start_codon:yes stop_codon:yes gene_type:complete
MINEIKRIVKEAGVEIIKIYKSDDYYINYKSDNSPVTKADKISNEIITRELFKAFNYPIISEEEPVKYEERIDWVRFFLIDPLDGTKNFISKNGEFSINIALIEKNKPILGVVYNPLNKDIYYAELGKGAFKNHTRILNKSRRKNLIAADSIFHSSLLTQNFFKEHNIQKVLKFGSSIKICKLAEGLIDVYPRLNGTKEWDTAASHIIAKEAGCKLIDILTKEELVYNKNNFKNNFFIASRNDLKFEV